MTADVALGIDVGGTGTRWRAVTGDSSVRGEGSVAPFTGHLFDPARRAAAQTALTELHRQLAAAAIAPARVVAGVTGLETADREATACAELIAEILEIASAQVTVLGDLDLVYRTAFAPGAGIVVYAGTGSAACHRDVGGRLWRVGGLGHILDDAGSAYWIGREAARWLARRWQAPSPPSPTPLAETLCEAIGGTTWPDLRRYAYRETREHIAALSLPVAAAANAGDDTARGILAAAGHELAALAQRMIDNVGAKPIAFAGRVAVLHPLIADTLAATLSSVTVVETPPVVTAADLAIAALTGRD